MCVTLDIFKISNKLLKQFLRRHLSSSRKYKPLLGELVQPSYDLSKFSCEYYTHKVEKLVTGSATHGLSIVGNSSESPDDNFIYNIVYLMVWCSNSANGNFDRIDIGLMNQPHKATNHMLPLDLTANNDHFVYNFGSPLYWFYDKTANADLKINVECDHTGDWTLYIHAIGSRWRLNN